MKEAVYLVYLSDQEFKDSIDLLLIFSKLTSHYVYIKDFDRFMFGKTKNKGKKYFCKSYLQCFSSENVRTKHKKDCLAINGKQNIKLESGFIRFNNYFRKKPVPFKTYGDFECILKSCDISIDNVFLMREFHLQKNIKIMCYVVLLIK